MTYVEAIVFIVTFEESGVHGVTSAEAIAYRVTSEEAYVHGICVYVRATSAEVDMYSVNSAESDAYRDMYESGNRDG